MFSRIVLSKQLQKTRAGFTLAKLRKNHAGTPLGDAARRTEKKWRSLAAPVVAETATGKGAKKAGVETTSREHSEPGKEKERASVRSPEVDMSHLSAKRRQMVSLMEKKIAKVVTENIPSHRHAAIPGQSQLRAVQLEEALFHHHGGDNHDRPGYSAQFRSIHYNFGANTDLCVNFYNGRMSATDIATCDPDMLASPEFRKQQEEERKQQEEEVDQDWMKKNKKRQMESAGLKVEPGQFKCHKCNGRNTDYFQKQTRSADEPMTTCVAKVFYQRVHGATRVALC